MLTSLHIENVAVIKSVDIDFSSGFTALTGETGAGKSVIIDSINFLLGSKAERTLVRFNAESAMVSGCFTEISEASLAALSDCGVYPDDDGNIFIQRTLSKDGKSQVKINGRTVTQGILKTLAPSLVSIHGQSDTASLTDSENHIRLLDVYAKNEDELRNYSSVYEKLEAVRGRIKDISDKERERERLREILEYQIKDIESNNLHSGEEEELVEKKVKIRNSEKIIKHSDFVYKALRGAEKVNVVALLEKSANSISQLSEYVPDFAEYSEKLRDFAYQIEDIAETVASVNDGLDVDPTETLNAIESRLDKISKLKRKYGLTVDDILAFLENAKKELSELDNSEEILDNLQKEEKAFYEEALVIAQRLHDSRAVHAKQLEDKVKETLEFLDMPKVVFFASMSEQTAGDRKRLTSDGFDFVEFYISANRGADPQPLSKIASGGELARIMLALKSTIADKDGVSTLIFDEIDAGVSGKTARKIGIKMLSLSKTVQLLCVTHSAQIASLSDVHYLISKGDVNGATESRIEALDDERRVVELSRILGGIDVTASQRAAAEDMLSERKNYI